MKKIFSFLAIVGIFATTVTFAQNNKAHDILEKVTHNLKKAKTIKADFSIAVKNSQGHTVMSKEGTFLMKGNQYKVALAGGQQIICDAHSVWTYLPKNKEVQVSKYDPQAQTISPTKLLSGAFIKDYDYTYSGTKTISGVKNDVITLKPKKAAPFTKILLYINPNKRMVSGGDIFNHANGSYSYSISNVKMNAPISGDTFHFDSKSHPGVDVIDLR